MVVCTVVLSLFTVNLWFYYTRAYNCCLETRRMLGCSSDFTQPCREFTGCVMRAVCVCVCVCVCVGVCVCGWVARDT